MNPSASFLFHTIAMLIVMFFLMTSSGGLFIYWLGVLFWVIFCLYDSLMEIQ